MTKITQAKGYGAVAYESLYSKLVKSSLVGLAAVAVGTVIWVKSPLQGILSGYNTYGSAVYDESKVEEGRYCFYHDGKAYLVTRFNVQTNSIDKLASQLFGETTEQDKNAIRIVSQNTMKIRGTRGMPGHLRKWLTANSSIKYIKPGETLVPTPDRSRIC